MTMNNSQGKDSSDDEDLRDLPDDDQYDTEDSFIDDAELVSIIVILYIHVDLCGALSGSILFIIWVYVHVDLCGALSGSILFIIWVS